MEIRIKNWNDLIKIYEACKHEELDDDSCSDCVLHKLYGEWEQEEVDKYFNKKMKRKKETACFLIAHKDQNTQHTLNKIKQLILFLE